MAPPGSVWPITQTLEEKTMSVPSIAKRGREPHSDADSMEVGMPRHV